MGDFTEADFATCRSALLRAAKRMRDDGWWHLGTAEKPITAASISQGMGKEMAYHPVMKTVREGLLAEILCLPEQDGPRAPVATPPETLREFYEEVMRRLHDDDGARALLAVPQAKRPRHLRAPVPRRGGAP